MELKDLKAGDKVIVSSRYYKYVREVQKITPAGYIKVNDTFYNLDGYQRGGDYFSRTRIQIATPEQLQAIADNELIQKAAEMMRNQKSLTLEQARQIIAILED